MFESVDRIVMKEEKSNKTKLVIFRLTPKEYANLEAKRSRTTCRKLSEFLRLLIFNRPVTVIERNGSQDQMIGECRSCGKNLTGLVTTSTRRPDVSMPSTKFQNSETGWPATKLKRHACFQSWARSNPKPINWQIDGCSDPHQQSATRCAAIQ
jgi:hypothetical protein